MDVEALSSRLIDNPDEIIKVLKHLGFDEELIKYNTRKKCLSAPRPSDDADNPNGFLLYTDKLKWLYTTRSGKGNIYSLVMELRNCNFPQALRNIADWIGYKDTHIHIQLPFGGFFKHLERDFEEVEELPVYSEKMLPPADSLSHKFVQDGISLLVQEEWGVRYDHESDSILIPIYDLMGRLVGCKARNNDPNCDFNHRWWAYLEYNKTQVLFGAFQNYSHIIEKDLVIVGESEKFPLQAESMGARCCVGIGGHNISFTQSKLLRSLGVKKIILAFDEGISEEDIQSQCKALAISSPFYAPEIYYIFDRDNKYLKAGSKDSPADLSRANFKAILKECRIKYEWENNQEN